MRKVNCSSLVRQERLIICIFALLCFTQVLTAQLKLRHKFDIRIPMRDGVELSADMWMPKEEGRYPVILVRTPYLKSGDKFPEAGKHFASQGYVFLVQDVRGRGDSDGEFEWFFADGKDGYDTIEWIAQQPWCNGKVGMRGSSYLGTVQWLAAREQSPHLVCITPTAPAGRYFDEIPYTGGAWMMRWSLTWLNLTSGRSNQKNNASVDWDNVFKHRPILTMDEVMGRRMRFYREFLEHNTIDDYWKRILFSPNDYRNMDLAVLQVTGWFDGDQMGTITYWDGMNKYSPAKDKQYLVIGPWDHGQTFRGGALKMGEMEFSGDSVIDRKAQHLDFFNHYLKGSTSEYDHPRVKVYITGSNKWLELKDYPPPQAQHKPLYFHSEGKANTLGGDGSLSWVTPQNELPDNYTYNPKNPVPSERDGHAIDNRVIERRDDVLVYTTEEIKDSLTILGQVFVNLYAASDALDTDFTAKLLDVYPDGRAINLGLFDTGIRRARYRNGYEKEELLTPNQPEKYKIVLCDIGHTFLPGHKIRIEISSSAFPEFNPNQNTGNPVATDTEWKNANQTIFHDSQRPSHVVLPVLPKQ